MNYIKTSGLAFRIWLLTGTAFSVLIMTIQIVFPIDLVSPWLFPAIVFGGSLPVLVLLLVAIPLIKHFIRNARKRVAAFIVIEALAIIPYAMVGGAIGLFGEHGMSLFITFVFLMISASLSTFVFASYMYDVFDGPVSNKSSQHIYNHSSIKLRTMETERDSIPKSQSNKILFKGLIAGGLVLIMLIPTFIVQNLVAEREARQKEVVQEVSAKWATSQTLAGPFLMVPYTESAMDSQGKPVFIKREIVILSQKMNVTGEIKPVSRPRSIYKVLLYKSSLDLHGSFQPKWPSGIDSSGLDFANAKLCLGISDFKGIEEEISINIKGENLVLSPGLPQNKIAATGLSVPVALTYENLRTGIDYKLNVKLKGSERLHFVPLSANSSFALRSTWPSPSFDGNALPNERNVHAKGFDAKWNYTQANLPFGTVIRNEADISSDISFGVSMVQPADQYNKTMRSIKYAILIIGLTFALFFIIEIMQGKPFHPVQYVLVGLALVIFYTLLLAISEYVLFDYAYLIAAVATISLIALYAKSHFHSWKTAAVFASVLSMLYGFIFILLRLEDTALLVGSIGLFIVLAIVMYVSRKVNWYGAGVVQVVD